MLRHLTNIAIGLTLGALIAYAHHFYELSKQPPAREYHAAYVIEGTI